MPITVTLSSVCSVRSLGQRLQLPAVNALLEITSALCLSISCLASQPISELEIVKGDMKYHLHMSHMKVSNCLGKIRPASNLQSQKALTKLCA